MKRPQNRAKSPLYKLIASVGVAVNGAITNEALAADGAQHQLSILDLSAGWLNFICYVALLYFLLRKAIPNAWRARRTRILTAVEGCKAELQSAERELSAIEARTKNLAVEQMLAKDEIRQQAEVEAATIEQRAKERAARIESQAKDLMVGELRSAHARFRAALVAKALELTKGRFARGEFLSQQQSYLDAAVGRAKRLVQ